jgi:hypothetical protein
MEFSVTSVRLQLSVSLYKGVGSKLMNSTSRMIGRQEQQERGI